MLQQLSKQLINSDSHHLSILAANPENQIFNNKAGDAYISYREQGKYLFTIGGVICQQGASEQFKTEVLNEFQSFAKQKRRRVIALHFSEDEQAFYKQQNYAINQLGSCYSIDLKNYTMAGRKMSQLRNKISKAQRKGVEVVELKSDAELEQYRERLNDIDRQWLNKKAAKALNFMVTDRQVLSLNDDQHRLYIALLDEQVIAYVLYSRSYGKSTGWFHNLSRHAKDAPMGTMQMINGFAITQFQEDDAGYLHFGFTPMADLQQDLELDGFYSKTFKRLTHFLQKHGDAIYPAKGQRQYKMSWRPQILSPDYIAIQGGFRISALWAFLKITNSI